jgi:hypothetical protein
MLLIPFSWDTDSKNGWIKFGVFLCSAGREIWSVDDTSTDADMKDLLEANGFPVLKITRMPTAVFAYIDHTTLKLNDFYLWSEVDPSKSQEDVWRIYNIPRALWTCEVFKEHFWKTSDILPYSAGFTKMLSE